MRVVGAKQVQAADDRLDARWIDGLANVLQRVDNARVPAAEARPAPGWSENERHVFGDDVVLIAGGEPHALPSPLQLRSGCTRGLAPSTNARLKSQRRLTSTTRPPVASYSRLIVAMRSSVRPSVVTRVRKMPLPT